MKLWKTSSFDHKAQISLGVAIFQLFSIWIFQEYQLAFHLDYWSVRGSHHVVL